MARTSKVIDVYVEVGTKRTFAGAVEWPGWCRSGRDEAAALLALLDYAPRYAAALQPAQLEFQPPADVAAFNVVERLEGTSTTDFGAPDVSPYGDAAPVSAAELQRFHSLLVACWKAFDQAVQAAAGHELRKGPRGGGRDVDEIARHVLEAEKGYLARLGRKVESIAGESPDAEVARARQAILEALAAGARGDIPAHGPRGGKFWTPRYFTRRLAWHVLDHVWEIEDRVI